MLEKQRYQQAKQITVIGIISNIVLSAAKIFFGVVGYSQALIADGMHSLSDVLIDGIVLIAAKASCKKPDAEHPYGHGRIETAFTILLAALLILAGSAIAYNGALSLLHTHPAQTPQGITLVVAAFSLLLNEALFHLTYRVGKRTRSNLLIANAWHRRSDALSSLIVFIGIGGDLIGFEHLDATAAIVVALLIIKMGVVMIRKSFSELTDTALSPEILKKIKTTVLKIPGVMGIHQLRTRSSGHAALVEIHIQVTPEISVSEGHYISVQTIQHLLKNFEEITDVTVHIDTEDDEDKPMPIDRPDRFTLLPILKKHWEKLPLYDQTQEIILHYLHGKIIVDLYFPRQTLPSIPDVDALTKQYQEAISALEYIETVRFYFH